MLFSFLLSSSFSLAALVKAQTPSQTTFESATTALINTISTVTPNPSITCSSGSTVLTTTECTYGHIYSLCHSPEATIICSAGYYPSVWYPVRCFSQSTCYPLPTTTSRCETHGFTAYNTFTAFNGVLDNGTFTKIEFPQCACSGHVSVGGKAPYASYCMPTGQCPGFMVSSTSTYRYTDASQSLATRRFTSCDCPAGQTREMSRFFEERACELTKVADYGRNTVTACGVASLSSSAVVAATGSLADGRVTFV